MSTPRDPDPISTQLHETEVRLERQLDEVCEMKEVGDESTGQFIKLEEKLLEAAELAKQAFSLRRRRRLEQQAAGEPETAEEHGADAAAAPRSIVDDDGTTWHVWAVSAERMRANPLTGGRLGAYRDGWLAFETDDGKQRRRLPGHPAEWATMSDAELRVLLLRAEPVRASRSRAQRRPQGADEAEAP